MEEAVFSFFKSYAYQPYLIYGAIIFIMFISSFGFPIPEEVTHIATGIIVNIGLNNPPPYPGATPVNPYAAATVAYFAAFFSDYVIFWLGRNYGTKMLQWKIFKKYSNQIDKISHWTKKYGFWASGIFRFTPGLRFPGHFSCGMLGLAPWKFIAVDGMAALIGVPTQILLISFYGREIIKTIQQFKIIFFSIVGVAVVVFLIYKLHKYIKKKRAEKKAQNTEL